MKFTTLCMLLLAAVAWAAPQTEDALQIPVENDNQFPPDNNFDVPDEATIEGSGVGAIEEPVEVTVTTEYNPPPPLEDVQLPISEDVEPTANETEDSSCPKQCVCHVEGESNNFVVDCSGYGLTEFPTPIDTKTTTLNLQNNKLTEIPKEISTLKNLKVLNADSNSIMDLVSGSVSELPELEVLKLGNNRLIEYPKDLKNSFGLTKLQELDLGGNDMRSTLNRDIFSHFTALKKLTLPSAAKDLTEDLCASMKETLTTVCTESCDAQLFECPDAPQNIEEDFLNVILPGTISLSSALDENADAGAALADAILNVDTTEATETPGAEIGTESSVPVEPEIKTNPEVAIRSSVIKEGISPLSTIVEAPKPEEPANDHKDAEVTVGATTSGSKSGGVDKSVIGMIVAGMVLVVAGITIKKNWSSIRNRFSSSPRAANERPGATANGTAPEEVPLQEKSPV